MDARTDHRSRLPGRDRVAAAVAVASGGPAIAAVHGSLGVGKTFKKTPCAAGLKPLGRDVAKDMLEITSIPLLMKTLPDHGQLHGDCLTVMARTIAKNLKSAKCEDGDIDAVEATLNAKLSDSECAGRQTKSAPRQTNHRSGALWEYAQPAGLAVDGAANHPGGAHEKQCYADV